jgi:hypothetical protein
MEEEAGEEEEEAGEDSCRCNLRIILQDYFSVKTQMKRCTHHYDICVAYSRDEALPR